ncbi:hypothetical protein V2O64_10035 [Verrucomicrobiaceae bacterium 227]
MNRKKRTSQIGLPTLILLLVSLAIVTAGGIGYVVMKNKQVTARREISRVQQLMEEHKVSITLHKTDIEAALDFYKLREQLADIHSPLVEIPPGVVEVYASSEQESPPGEAVAQR